MRYDPSCYTCGHLREEHREEDYECEHEGCDCPGFEIWEGER